MNLFECTTVLESHVKRYETAVFYRQFNLEKAQTIRALVDKLKKLEAQIANSNLDTLDPRVLEGCKVAQDSQLLVCFDLIQDIQSDILAVQNNPAFTWYDRVTMLSPLQASIEKIHLRLRDFKLYWQAYIAMSRSFLSNYYENIQFLMNQDMLPAAVNGRAGYCYGIGLDYAAYRRNKTSIQPPFRFSATAVKLQHCQFTNRPIDNISLKYLGRVHYQPNLTQQARALATEAQAYPNQGIGISLMSLIGGSHFAYIEYTSEAKLHYFDSNYGAFEFSNIEDFVQFYAQLYRPYFRWIVYQTVLIAQSTRPETYRERLQFVFGRIQPILAVEFVYALLCLLAFALTCWLMPALLVFGGPFMFMKDIVFLATLCILVVITCGVVAAARSQETQAVENSDGAAKIDQLINALPELKVPASRMVSSVSMFLPPNSGSDQTSVSGSSYQPLGI